MKVHKTYLGGLFKAPKLYDNGFYCIKISVVVLLREFYALQALASVAKPKYGVHSHEMWEKDFNEYKTHFESILAKMLHDYIALICLGEMRHAEYESGYGVKFDGINFNSNNFKREEVYINKRDFTMESTLQFATWIFNDFNNRWNDNYGGYNWWLIAKAGLMYKKEPDSVFIDHCFDLEHNGGNIFNKEGYMFEPSNSVEDMLDNKRNDKYPYRELQWACTGYSQKLVERAINIGLIDFSKDYRWRENPVFSFYRIGYPIHLSNTGRMYLNQFYPDNNRILNGLGKIDFIDLMNMYKPFHWGNKDMDKEAIVFETSNFENERRRYRYVENY